MLAVKSCQNSKTNEASKDIDTDKKYYHGGRKGAESGRITKANWGDRDQQPKYGYGRDYILSKHSTNGKSQPMFKKQLK